MKNKIENKNIEVMMHGGTEMISIAFPKSKFGICLSVFLLEKVLKEYQEKNPIKASVPFNMRSDSNFMERAKLIASDIKNIIKKNNLP